MLNRPPWDPFPAGEPDPRGPDPVHAALYRAAVSGGDAYRAVRQVLRVDHGVLRVGNRFVPADRYRQVGFLALGHAGVSMALAALDALGERLTQGFVAAPDLPPEYLPFRSVRITDGWGADPSAPVVQEAAREIALGLGPNDLLLVLISPGAGRAVVGPGPQMSVAELGRTLEEARRRGASGPECATLLRVAGGGGVGGNLLPAATACEVQTFLVDRGDGPERCGGGPTVPVTEAERAAARALVDRLGLSIPFPTAETNGARPTIGHRPVLVAGPSDALRAAADLAFDKGWTSRIGDVLFADGPEATAERLSARTEELLPDARRSAPGHSKGLVVLSMTTLDVPDGVAEDDACRTFVARALAGLRRREASVGIFRTGGPLGAEPRDPRPTAFAGAVVGAPTDPDPGVPLAPMRAVRMRAGITDVGILTAAIVPAPRSGGGGR